MKNQNGSGEQSDKNIMNTNSKAKQILFYGDSLVYGKKPSIAERFDADIRFTGVTQKILGDEYNVIEEGLRARNLFGENLFFAERNGLDQFGPIFGSHVPVDMVIIMLGTNDCNKSKEKIDEEYFKAFDSYIEKIQLWSKPFANKPIPKILIVASPYVRGIEVEKDAKMNEIFGKEAEEKSKKLATIYSTYCQKNNIAFFDASTICVTADGEGIHLDEENNGKLGMFLAHEIRKLVNKI